MQSSKLIRTLKKFSPEELQQFRIFVVSPYFNASKEAIRLLDFIISEKVLESNLIDSHLILEKLYPDKKQAERYITDITYTLTNLVEEFIAMEAYRADPLQKKLKLLSRIYERDFDALAKGIEKDLDTYLDKSPNRDSRYFFDSFLIHSERDYGFRRHGKISGNESLQVKSDQLDLFFLTLKLKDACEMLNQSRIVSVQYDLKMIDMIVHYLQAHPELYNQYAAIQIYLCMYLMLTGNDHEKYFFELKKLADNNENTFEAEELRSIYGYAQNYCIRRLNQGDTDYLGHLFEIYKQIMQNGLVFVDTNNMQWEFKNMVSIGLRAREYEWTFKIIEIFKEKLPADVKQNAYTYNLANYYYEIKEYQKATRLLNSVEFTDIYYNLDSKAMLLKIYYKLGEDESFYALVSAFGIYLRRNKFISKDTAEVYNNLIKFAKKAYSLHSKRYYERDRNFAKNLDRLKQAIQKTKNIANINWLNSEIAGLE